MPLSSSPTSRRHQKDILKALRGGVPPQPTLLADHLLRWVQENPEARHELEDIGNTRTSFPATVRLWQDFRERLGRQIEVRAPRCGARSKTSATIGGSRRVDSGGSSRSRGLDNGLIRPIVQRLVASAGNAELIEEVVAAVSNKETRQLSQEDYGRASGILEVLQSLAPHGGRTAVVLPDGSRRDLPAFAHEQASVQMRETVRGWQVAFSLSPEQTAALLLDAVYSDKRSRPRWKVNRRPSRQRVHVRIALVRGPARCNLQGGSRRFRNRFGPRQGNGHVPGSTGSPGL